MTPAEQVQRLRRVTLMGGGFVIVAIALHEYTPILAALFGAPLSPIRHVEFLIEAGMCLAVMAAVFPLTSALERRGRQVEGFFTVCSWCRRVKVEGRWQPVSEFLTAQTKVQSEVGLCPDCYSQKGATTARGPTTRHL